MKKRIVSFVLVLAIITSLVQAVACSKSGSTVKISSGDKEYSLSIPDKVNIIIPPNALSSGSEITLEEVTKLISHDFGGFTPLALYDIKTSSGSEFQASLKLEFSYNAATLDTSLDAAAQLAVGYYNDEYGAWQEVDFEINEAESKIIVTTDHLSLWSIFVKEEKYITSSAPGFTIYFNKDAKAPAIGQIVSGDPLFEYASIVRTGLYDARTAYEKLGFKLPEHTKVYIDTWNADKEAEWGWFSKNIEIPVTYIDEKELHMVSAHELFHAVQNQYITFATMAAERWWMEATADYAAAHIASSYGLKDALPQSYLSSGVNDSKTFHMYQTAHFVKFLVDSGLDFKEMFEYVVTQSGGVLANLATFCVTKGLSLPQLYENFAYAVLFQDSVKTAGSGADIYIEQAKHQLEMDLDTISASNTLVNVGSNYASTLFAVRVIGDRIKSMELPVRAIEATSGIQVRFATESGPDKSAITNDRGLSHEAVDVKVEDGDYLYFLVTNYASQAGSVIIVIGEDTGGQFYSQTRTAKIYNNQFLADFDFDLYANQPFTVSQESMNEEYIYLILDFEESAKDIVLDVEAIVTNLRFANPGEWGEGREPVIKEMYWSTSDGQVSNSKTQVTLPQDDPRGLMSFGYEMIIEIYNRDEDQYFYGGGAALIGINIRIMKSY